MTLALLAACSSNSSGPVHEIETDVSAVFEDEAAVSSVIYESL